MWIGFSPRVDSVSGALAEVPDLAKNLSEDLEQYVSRSGYPWRPDVRIVSDPRAGIRLSYVDRYGTTCPIALFRLCPPEEGPDAPEPTWWLEAVYYPTPLGDPLYRAMVFSAAGWLRRRPHVVKS